MNTTATTTIALTALAAPVLAGLAIGLATTATADTNTTAPSTAGDTIAGLKDQGYNVVVNTAADESLKNCSIISTHQDRREHIGGPQKNQYITVYVDAYCPPTAK